MRIKFHYFWSFASESIVSIGKADWYFTSAPKFAVRVCVCVCVHVHAAHTACSWHRQQQACLQRFPSTPSTPNKTESLPQVEWYITLQSFRRFCAVLRSTCYSVACNDFLSLHEVMQASKMPTHQSRSHVETQISETMRQSTDTRDNWLCVWITLRKTSSCWSVRSGPLNDQCSEEVTLLGQGFHFSRLTKFQG